MQLNRVLHGDFITIGPQLPANAYDLIFTDPPYAKKYFYTYQYLAEFAPRLLKKGGSLVTIIPHYALQEVLDYFAHFPLKWRWPYIQTQESGAHPRMAMGVEVCYKLYGHWVNGSYPSGRGFLRDAVPANPPHNKSHKWEQDIAPALYYIERLCPPGGLMLDPYCGSGTYLAAAKSLGRNYLGIDIDPAAVALSRQRLKRRL